LAIGDGGLEFWAALREEFPKTIEQRCCVHKTANILDKMPKGVQPRAKVQIRGNVYGAGQGGSLQGLQPLPVRAIPGKILKACNCLEKDRDIQKTVDKLNNHLEIFVAG